jgi:hypothetical protein
LAFAKIAKIAIEWHFFWRALGLPSIQCQHNFHRFSTDGNVMAFFVGPSARRQYNGNTILLFFELMAM